jgi:K+-sensing histidine kinase KdpD
MKYASEVNFVRKPQLSKLVPTIQRFGFAVLCVAVALGAALLLQQFNFRDVDAPLFLFAVAAVALHGGAGAAVLALLLSCIAFAYFFVEPRYSFDISGDVPYFFCFRLIRGAGHLVQHPPTPH